MKIASLGDLLPDTINLYAWGDGQVLKLYDPDAPPDGVTWIASVDRALFEAGLPVPAVGETLEIEGCLGQVYERIEGPTIAAAVRVRTGATRFDRRTLSHLRRGAC